MIRRRPALIATVVVLASTLLGPGPAAAQPPSAPCPWATTPPPAVDASEVPAPGTTAPAPLPRPSAPVGGAALGGCGVVQPDGAAAVPQGISAQSWVVADMDTGEVLAAQDPHALHRPASTLKVLTALLVLRTLPLEQVVVGTDADAAVEGSGVGVGPGGVYTVRDLLTGLLLQSGNDAANALAEAMGGVGPTVEAMTALAASLGALDTRAATPSGLDGPGMSTSAYDLALLFRAAMADPVFAELTATRTATFPGYGDQPPFAIDNDDKLLTGYPGAVGGKAGYTDDSRHTFVGAAERDGRRLVVSLLGAERTPVVPWQQAAALLDHGFATTEGVGTLVTASPGASPTAVAAGAPGTGTSAAGAGTPTAAGLVGTTVLALLTAVTVLVLVVVADAGRRRRA